ncbi:Gti1/Pac2 family-domain-containing protein [Multifurca ochricompacta]|uniref:Gti1/Pac2 family-domain-containing protein n=1 Tax=Multifurca ochricompacta TaxID=376703 RepID=A0AAD4QKD8_9AGAM|nr:Gti1/Pac2 family-domain-containing protein [Multifurca ochricompacta]
MSSPPDTHSNGQGSSATWTEPPWSGWIETTGDALLILEAARRGLIPRVTRRLVDSERKMITSGSVFVFDEDESGIKRWTDGFFWSPSRILGNFLLYRETEKRGAGHRGTRNEAEQGDQVSGDITKAEGQTLSRPRGETTRLGIDRQRERSLVGSLTNSYKFKAGGMMKKTFSLTISGVSQHLISYYKIEDVEQGRLRAASSYPELASLDISPEYLEKTHFRNPPKVEIGVDGVPRYRGEADDVEPSPHVLNSALAVGMPLLSEPMEVGPGPALAASPANAGKRNKRYDPYAPTKNKRKSRNSIASASAPTSPTDTNSSYAPVPTGFADPNMAMLQHAHYAATYGLAPAYPYPLGFSMPAPSSVYPPGTMFPPPGSLPPGAIQSTGPPGSPLPAQMSSQAMAPYHAYASPSAHVPPPPGGEGSPMAMQTPGQQGYYQYYPPPGYPSYWPPYHTGASYPPSAQTGSPTSPVSASTVASGVESHIKAGEESEDSLTS